MKKIFKKVTMILCSILIMVGFVGKTTSISNADIFKGGFSTKVEAPKKCRILKYTIKGALPSREPITQWSGVSSKLKLQYTKSEKDADIVINYLTHSHTKKAGTVVPYYKGKKVNENSRWDKVQLYVYKHPYNVLIKGYEKYYHSSYKYETLAHEMGHVLGVAHTTNSKVKTIMYEGRGASGFHPYKITDYDKSQLRKKWGK